MVVRCCISACVYHSKYDTKWLKLLNCKMHRVPPVGDQRRQLWLKSLGLPPTEAGLLYVCSLHFNRDDFHHTGCIKATAVPSRFLLPGPTAARPPSSAAAQGHPATAPPPPSSPPAVCGVEDVAAISPLVPEPRVHLPSEEDAPEVELPATPMVASSVSATSQTQGVRQRMSQLQEDARQDGERQRMTWDYDEVITMLSVLAEMNIERQLNTKSVRNGDIFAKAEKQLEEKHLYRSAMQIREKYRLLKKQYYEVKGKNENGGSQQWNTMAFMEEMEALMNHQPVLPTRPRLLDTDTVVPPASRQLDTDVHAKCRMSQFLENTRQEREHLEQRQLWEHDEVRTMLNIFAEMNIERQLNTMGVRKVDLFVKVEEELEEQHIYRSAEQIQKKYRLLKKQYYEVKGKNENGGSQQWNTMAFMEEMEALMNHRPVLPTRPRLLDTDTVVPPMTRQLDTDVHVAGGAAPSVVSAEAGVPEPPPLEPPTDASPSSADATRPRNAAIKESYVDEWVPVPERVICKCGVLKTREQLTKHIFFLKDKGDETGHLHYSLKLRMNFRDVVVLQKGSPLHCELSCPAPGCDYVIKRPHHRLAGQALHRHIEGHHPGGLPCDSYRKQDHTLRCFGRTQKVAVALGLPVWRGLRPDGSLSFNATKDPAKDKSATARAKNKSTTAPAKGDSTMVPAKDKSTTVPRRTTPLIHYSSTKDKSTTAPAKDKSTMAPAKVKSTMASAKDKSTTAPAKDESTTAPATEGRSNTAESTVSLGVGRPQSGPLMRYAAFRHARDLRRHLHTVHGITAATEVVMDRFPSMDAFGVWIAKCAEQQGVQYVNSERGTETFPSGDITLRYECFRAGSPWLFYCRQRACMPDHRLLGQTARCPSEIVATVTKDAGVTAVVNSFHYGHLMKEAAPASHAHEAEEEGVSGAPAEPHFDCSIEMDGTERNDRDVPETVVQDTLQNDVFMEVFVDGETLLSEIAEEKQDCRYDCEMSEVAREEEEGGRYDCRVSAPHCGLRVRAIYGSAPHSDDATLLETTSPVEGDSRDEQSAGVASQAVNTPDTMTSNSPEVPAEKIQPHEPPGDEAMNTDQSDLLTQAIVSGLDEVKERARSERPSRDVLLRLQSLVELYGRLLTTLDTAPSSPSEKAGQPSAAICRDLYGFLNDHTYHVSFSNSLMVVHKCDDR